MTINFFGLDRLYKEHSQEIISITEQIYETGMFLAGSEIEKLEKNLCEKCNRKYAVAVANCTDAIFFALTAAGIKPEDEIITTSFSFIASTSPILRIGATPVFTEIAETDFMIDSNLIENQISNKTKAILGVHLFGQLFSENIDKIADKNNLILIEDAAQSFGSVQNNKPAGSRGLISCLSFDPTKIIGAFGNGGALLTDDYDIYQKLIKLRYHGKHNADFELLGYNSRISTVQAALLNMQLKYLDEWIKRRNEIATIYKQKLQNNKNIILPIINTNTKHIFHKFVIKANDRDNLKKFLSENNIATQIHYEKALFENSLLTTYKYVANDIIIAHLIKNTVLSLPIYPELTNQEVYYICEKINEFYNSSCH